MLEKNILKNPSRALQIASQLGASAASKNPTAIMNAGMQAGRFGISGRGITGEKLVTLTDEYGGNGLYLKVR